MERIIRISERADREIARARAWWYRHRELAPHLLDLELSHALELLSSFPELGVRTTAQRGSARRLLLRRTRYFLHYRIDPTDGAVEIGRFVHAARKPR